MKAEINGVKLEGTPEEITKVVELMKPTSKATAAPSPTMEDLLRRMQEQQAQTEKFLPLFPSPSVTWAKPPRMIDARPQGTPLYPKEWTQLGSVTAPNTTTLWYL